MKHYNELSTAHGSINLKIDDWANASQDRDALLDKWDDTFDLIYKYLIEGGIKDKYIQPKDAPGYRGYEDVPSLYKYIDEEDADITLSLIYSIPLNP